METPNIEKPDEPAKVPAKVPAKKPANKSGWSCAVCPGVSDWYGRCRICGLHYSAKSYD